jgi:hypothetical protein
MLRPIQYSINLLQRLPTRLYPIIPDKNNLKNIPRSIYHVRFPPYASEGKWEGEDAHESDNIEEEGEDSHAIGADGIVEDFGWVEIEERSPSEGIGTLEDEY